MPRSLDDDAPRRMSNADSQLSADMQQAAVNDRATLRNLRHIVKNMERGVARRRRRARWRFLMLLIAGGSFLTGATWTALAWGSPGAFVRVDIVCGGLLLLSGTAALRAGTGRGDVPLAELEDGLDTNRDSLRSLSARHHPTVQERRSLYREDVAGFIEQHRIDSRKYRRVHNILQNLIMVGSASTTTVAALETRNQFTWQNITIVAIGFTVTLAAAFTGYYKFRERSYFLLQTADAIEEEINAFTLGVGPYGNFGPDEDQEALKLFTQRVESHRNEQRRRQQQLDQPAEQAPPTGAAST
ncbi:DUF4231 domain-containing protein [Streptomyces sp. NPDC005968]|uniref:DUF4231 domain-containing protein n=1 Tax=Streptomyces sp. NPDC005968 TaxID=3154574 RepID=UPI0033EED6B2